VTLERVGVVIIRAGHVALIERQNGGRRYWVIPGGGVETGETLAEAAQREAAEELGVNVELGALRVCIDHREKDGSVQRQWYYDAVVRSEQIRIIGPEVDRANSGNYRAVWIDLDKLELGATHPSAIAQLISRNRGLWPDELITIDEV
jgi:ADP-ribose pyrophosphatase YjhB (NUDIX family)